MACLPPRSPESQGCVQASVRHTRKKAYRGTVLSTSLTLVGDGSTEVLRKGRGAKTVRTCGNSDCGKSRSENARRLGTGLALLAQKTTRRAQLTRAKCRRIVCP